MKTTSGRGFSLKLNNCLLVKLWLQLVLIKRPCLWQDGCQKNSRQHHVSIDKFQNSIGTTDIYRPLTCHTNTLNYGTHVKTPNLFHNSLWQCHFDVQGESWSSGLPLLALNRLPADENFAIIGHWTSIPATHILGFWVLLLFYECSTNYLELIVCYY